MTKNCIFNWTLEEWTCASGRDLSEICQCWWAEGGTVYFIETISVCRTVSDILSRISREMDNRKPEYVASPPIHNRSSAMSVLYAPLSWRRWNNGCIRNRLARFLFLFTIHAANAVVAAEAGSGWQQQQQFVLVRDFWRKHWCHATHSQCGARNDWQLAPPRFWNNCMR